MIDVRSSDDLQPLRLLAAQIKCEWNGGARLPDARAAFVRHPALESVKTIVLDLTYRDYCLRRERGERVDPDEFCDQFPRHRAALRRLIDAHSGLSKNPGLLPDSELDFWPGVGENVADFTIIRELGRGNFARAYLATEASAGDRPVALKLTFEGGAEACILGRLPHPNVVHVNSAGEDDLTGLTRLCMPFLGSATLHDLLLAIAERGTAPKRAAEILDVVAAVGEPNDPQPLIEPGAAIPPEVLLTGSYSDGVAELGRQMADALAFVHRAGVYHRDLKPTNVLLTKSGRSVLLDFNLANDGLFAAARVGGTLPYMAPEQLRAVIDGCLIPAGLDGRADLFSFGVILYELLTGRLPFKAPPQDLSVEDGSPLMLDAQRKAFIPLIQLNPDVHPDLARIVERCLALQSEARFADAAELTRALSAYLARLQPAQRPVRRRQYALAGVILAVVLAATGSVAAPKWWTQRQQVTPEDQDSQRALFAEARKRMLAGDDAAAIVLFQKVESKQPDGMTLACLSYCMARSNQNAAALLYAEKARKLNFKSAAVFNNEGIVHLREGEPDKAYQAFSEAIELDHGLREAVQNRAILCLTRPATPVRLKEARAGLDIALQNPTAELFFQAALLACHANDVDAALRYLQQAVPGVPSTYLEKDPVLAPVRARPEFAALLSRAANAPLFPASSRLVDPARGMAD